MLWRRSSVPLNSACLVRFVTACSLTFFSDIFIMFLSLVFLLAVLSSAVSFGSVSDVSLLVDSFSLCLANWFQVVSRVRECIGPEQTTACDSASVKYTESLLSRQSGIRSTERCSRVVEAGILCTCQCTVNRRCRLFGLVHGEVYSQWMPLQGESSDQFKSFMLMTFSFISVCAVSSEKSIGISPSAEFEKR